MHVECVLGARAQVGEGPVWDPAEEVLWWTDINGRQMHRFDPRDRTDRAFAMPVRVGCFALRRAGGFVLAAERGFWFWKPGKAPEHIVDVECLQGRPDGSTVDEAGNYWMAAVGGGRVYAFGTRGELDVTIECQRSSRRARCLGGAVSTKSTSHQSAAIRRRVTNRRAASSA